MNAEMASVVVAGLTATLGALMAGATGLVASRLRKETDSESSRLRRIIASGNVVIAGVDVSAQGEPPVQSTEPDPAAGTQRVDDDKFAEVLIEYYAWGLTQARRSTALSLTCSGLGVLVILGGVALGIWRAESNGDLYASAATSAAGVVSTVVGHLAHRRADAAMTHMQRQTESLRQDMQREREIEASIRLLREVKDAALEAHLQAALVLKLAGATLPDLPAEVRREPSVSVPANGFVPPQDPVVSNGARPA
ncbi:hypothetical protein ACFW9N_11680 [Streptomyces sp. NPDC059496]|uniref:TRADD-N-associated membrane domain-containing protein n=1 Tax=Streptomyces sp. NPDC059496 TaxID=3346851 RepID=UPI0036B5F4A6